MTFEVHSGILRLPPEIIDKIIDYIQPIQCQVKLISIPVFRSFVLRKIFHLKKWIVSNNSLTPIIINSLLDVVNMEEEDLLPVGYLPPSPPIQINRNFKNIQIKNIDNENQFMINNVGSLIHTVKLFDEGIYPNDITFMSYDSFQMCREMCPAIITNANDITIRIAKFVRGNSHTGDKYWNQVNELINIQCDNISRLELQYIELDGLKLNGLSLLKSLKYLGQIKNWNQIFLELNKLPNLLELELTDIIVDSKNLKYLPDNLQSLKIEKIKIHQGYTILEFPCTLLNELLTSFELYDEQSIINLMDLVYLKKLAIFGCNELVSLGQLKLPFSIQELTIEGCDTLWETQHIKEYINLTSFTWSQALLSLDFYLNTTFPNSLTHLTVNGQDSKTGFIIDRMVGMMPQKFESIYGMQCFIIDHEFNLPNKLKSLSISNCRYLTVNCDKLKLPQNLKNLTLLNLASLKSISQLELPNSLTSLNLNSNKIKCVMGLKVPENLRVLKLDDNRLENIPDSLTTLKDFHSLTLVSLTDNLIPTQD